MRPLRRYFLDQVSKVPLGTCCRHMPTEAFCGGGGPGLPLGFLRCPAERVSVSLLYLLLKFFSITLHHSQILRSTDSCLQPGPPGLHPSLPLISGFEEMVKMPCREEIGAGFSLVLHSDDFLDLGLP